MFHQIWDCLTIYYQANIRTYTLGNCTIRAIEIHCTNFSKSTVVAMFNECNVRIYIRMYIHMCCWHLQASLRHTWLSDNMAIVSEDNFGTDVYATEAAFKKHETLEADVKVWTWYVCMCVYVYTCMCVCTYIYRFVIQTSLWYIRM